MSFDDYPALPSAWPSRTQDRDTFNQAAADAFDHYDLLPAFYTSLKSGINSATAALVASNLPTLTSQAGKAVFVNSAGTDVELTSILEYDQGTATSIGSIGDFGAVTYADAITGSLTLGWKGAVLMLGIARVVSTSTSQSFRLRLGFNGFANTTSVISGGLSASGDEQVAVAAGISTASTSGTYAFKLEAGCTANAEVSRATLIGIGLRTP